MYQRLGDRARLAALLEETAPLLEGASERATLRLQRARMAMDEDPDKAVALLQEVIEEDPSEVEAAAALSDLLERLGRREELGALVQRQLDAAKDREDRAAIVQLSLRLGALLEQQWDEQGALDAYHGALDWDAKNRELLRQIVRLGMTRDDSLALGDALDALLEVEQGEDAAGLAKRLADIRSAHGDAEGAEQALEQGWTASPGDARLRDELVRRYTASGDFRKLADVHVRDAETRPKRDERIEPACASRPTSTASARATSAPPRTSSRARSTPTPGTAICSSRSSTRSARPDSTRAPSTPSGARSSRTRAIPGSTARARRSTRRSGGIRPRSWISSRRTRRAAAATPRRSSQRSAGRPPPAPRRTPPRPARRAAASACGSPRCLSRAGEIGARARRADRAHPRRRA